MRRNTIIVNGVQISSNGGSITVLDGRVIIDGKDVTPDGKTISIEVSGDIERIDADVCERITVTGTVGEINTQSGDVQCGPVSGSVKTMSGDVTGRGVVGPVRSMSGRVRL